MKKTRNGLTKNLRYLCLIGVVVLGLLSLIGSNGGGGGGGGDSEGDSCENVAGTWSTTEEVDATDCGEGTYTEYNTYTVTQAGCNITLTASSGTYSGTVNGSQINWTGSWAEDGGTTIATVNLTISGDSLSGSASWTWSDGTDSCSGTTQISGTRTTTPVEEDIASVRFYNIITCGDDSFTATLDVCGTSLNSESGSWSSCKTVEPGDCSLSLSTESTNCGTISLSGSISLDSDCVYSFVLYLDDSDEPALLYYDSCPGDCNTATPFSAGASFESLSDGASLEILMKVPVGGEGFTSAQ